MPCAVGLAYQSPYHGLPDEAASGRIGQDEGRWRHGRVDMLIVDSLTRRWASEAADMWCWGIFEADLLSLRRPVNAGLIHSSGRSDRRRGEAGGAARQELDFEASRDKGVARRDGGRAGLGMRHDAEMAWIRASEASRRPCA